MLSSSLLSSSETASSPLRYTAFQENRAVSSGALPEVVREVKGILDRGANDQILIFDNETSEVVEVDFRGTVDDVLGRLSENDPQMRADLSTAERRGPGRPKLGVVGREVTLLPRHWDWLDDQPGGASVALRKLVEGAKKSSYAKDRVRRAQDATYRFMSTMAGDLNGFEEALRALYQGNRQRLAAAIASWPEDVRTHVARLAETATTDAAPAITAP